MSLGTGDLGSNLEGSKHQVPLEHLQPIMERINLEVRASDSILENYRDQINSNRLFQARS